MPESSAIRIPVLQSKLDSGYLKVSELASLLWTRYHIGEDDQFLCLHTLEITD